MVGVNLILISMFKYNTYNNSTYSFRSNRRYVRRESRQILSLYVYRLSTMEPMRYFKSLYDPTFIARAREREI